MDTPFHVGWWIDPPAAEPLHNCVTSGDFFAYVAAPPPTGSINPGRALCCLHMSFLC